MELFDEQVRSQQGLQTVVDPGGGELAPYLFQIFFKVINQCLKKHSMRPTSQKVMEWWNETNY